MLPSQVGPLVPIALAGLAAAVVTFPASSGPAYEGALPLAAALLVALGKISYGVYVVHWPVFVVVDSNRIGVDGVGLMVIRLAITLAIAVVSYRVIEQPIRHGARTTLVRLDESALAPLSTAGRQVAATTTTVVAISATAPDALATIDDPRVGTQQITSREATVIAAQPEVTAAAVSPLITLPPVPTVDRPVRVVVTGETRRRRRHGDRMGSGRPALGQRRPDRAV